MDRDERTPFAAFALVRGLDDKLGKKKPEDYRRDWENCVCQRLVLFPFKTTIGRDSARTLDPQITAELGGWAKLVQEPELDLPSSPEISSEHFRLVRKESVVYFEDQESLNGTRIKTPKKLLHVAPFDERVTRGHDCLPYSGKEEFGDWKRVLDKVELTVGARVICGRSEYELVYLGMTFGHYVRLLTLPKVVYQDLLEKFPEQQRSKFRLLFEWQRVPEKGRWNSANHFANVLLRPDVFPVHSAPHLEVGVSQTDLGESFLELRRDAGDGISAKTEMHPGGTLVKAPECVGAAPGEVLRRRGFVYEILTSSPQTQTVLADPEEFLFRHLTVKVAVGEGNEVQLKGHKIVLDVPPVEGRPERVYEEWDLPKFDPCTANSDRVRFKALAEELEIQLPEEMTGNMSFFCAACIGKLSSEIKDDRVTYQLYKKMNLEEDQEGVSEEAALNSACNTWWSQGKGQATSNKIKTFLSRSGFEVPRNFAVFRYGFDGADGVWSIGFHPHVKIETVSVSSRRASKKGKA